MIPLNLFTFTNRWLVTEASTLVANGFNPGNNIAVKSPSGRVETFTFSRTTLDNEAEVTSWIYVANNPECKVRLVRIFND